MQHSIPPYPSHDHHDLRRPLQPGGEPRETRSTERAERAVLAGVLVPQMNVDWRNPLGELAALAASAGADVMDSMIQKRAKLTPAYAMGKGKLAELVTRSCQADADVVIFDNDLTPRQIRGLERAIERKVIDRSELILDIFASRAKTHEAQLQVELAQLQYTAPRLRGMWTHLERIAGAAGATAAGRVGGVGTRGPGERQIEVDRRIVRDRITYLKREIRKIDRRKQREVRSRKDQFTVSLVGYTNSGKSTLMNSLTNAHCYVAAQLFATLDTKTVRWDLAEGRAILLSDTVGFVRDLPHHLVASFRATLEEAIHANLLLHVVDTSSPTAWQQMEAVDAVLASLGCDRLEQIVLLNKVDIANDTSMAEMIACHRSNALLISALTGEGLDQLVERVRRLVGHDTVEVTVRIPHAAGKLLNEIGRLAEVQGRRYGADHVELDIRIDRTQLSQLCGRSNQLVVISNDGWTENRPNHDDLS